MPNSTQITQQESVTNSLFSRAKLRTRTWAGLTQAAKLACLTAGLMITTTGCSTVKDHMEYSPMTDGWMMSWRNSVWSKDAWKRFEPECTHAHKKHFQKGFRQGYTDVATGGSGCVPPLAPREYYSWKYQSAEGQAKAAAWFAGYPHGARAAEQDGVSFWNQIPVSYVGAAMADNCPDCPKPATSWRAADQQQPGQLPTPVEVLPEAEIEMPGSASQFRSVTPQKVSEPPQGALRSTKDRNIHHSPTYGPIELDLSKATTGSSSPRTAPAPRVTPLVTATDSAPRISRLPTAPQPETSSSAASGSTGASPAFVAASPFMPQAETKVFASDIQPAGATAEPSKSSPRPSPLKNPLINPTPSASTPKPASSGYVTASDF